MLKLKVKSFQIIKKVFPKIEGKNSPEEKKLTLFFRPGSLFNNNSTEGAFDITAYFLCKFIEIFQQKGPWRHSSPSLCGNISRFLSLFLLFRGDASAGIFFETSSTRLLSK